MIAEINSRMFRPHAVNMGMRQQVASRTSKGMSKRMAKMVTLIICVSLFVVCAFSQVIFFKSKLRVLFTHFAGTKSG